MTKVKYIKKNNLFWGFIIEGHSGYSEEGSDIVCSAISTASQMTVVGLGVLDLKYKLKKDEKRAYLFCELVPSTNFIQLESAQPFFKTLEITLKDLECQFAKYIKTEVKDEIN